MTTTPKKCFYCDREVVRLPNKTGIPTPKYAQTIDHVVPRAKGGGDGEKVWACLGCNEDKGQLTLEEYRLVRAFRAGLAIPVKSFMFPGETQ